MTLPAIHLSGTSAKRLDVDACVWINCAVLLIGSLSAWPDEMHGRRQIALAGYSRRHRPGAGPDILLASQSQ